MLKALRKNEKGLTLIELLAVLVIVGIIAAIAIPAIGSTISNSKDKADTATIELIKDAAQRYVTDKELEESTTITVSQLVTDGYLAKLPTLNDGTLGDVNATISTNGTWSFEVEGVGEVE